VNTVPLAARLCHRMVVDVPTVNISPPLGDSSVIAGSSTNPR
jgi:hypothetical protein